MTTTNTTSKKSTNTLFILFVFMFLSASTAFGQEDKKTVSVVEPIEEIVAENTVASTTEFANWFINGVNKTTEDKPATLSFGRKQLINSGITTNKVLIKNVLKKVVGQETSIA